MMKTLTGFKEIGIFICKLLVAGFLIYYEVTLELPVSLIIILSVLALKLIIDSILWLIDVISITIYLSKLTDEDIEDLINNNRSGDYIELKTLLKSNVYIEDDDSKKTYKVRGYYLNYDDESDEIKTSVFLNDGKLYSMDKIVLTGEE